ncbi:MAG: M23 family metallopeptidase [Acidimicrobiales bacterium]
MARGVRLVVLVCVLSAGLVAPAGADPAADRERVRQERADAAAKLKAAEATDQELTDAVATLGSAEKGALGAAQQATRALQRAEADVTGAEGALSRQRRAVVDRAVRAYADQGHVQVMAGVGRPEDAARRLALAKVVQGRLVDAVDSSRAAVSDLTRRRQQQAAAARQAARALRQAVDASARSAKAKADLDQRIEGFRQEVDALNAEEAGINLLLVARASQAATPPPDPPVAPPAPGQPAAGPPRGGVSSSGFIWPVLGRLSSPFGARWGRMHQGQDIADPTGTPIKAPKAGRVIKAGGAGGYGNLTLLDHGGGIVTAYGHQSRFAVNEGDQVAQGQVIGYVGSTGHSTGPHLHFEVRVNGVARNPIPYLP